MSGANPQGPTFNARTGEQLAASDPQQHVWVSASAGTGKTQVLTDRMLRLMLNGADPGRILAVTFTRAAAAEMQIRISRSLSAWLRMDDEALSTQLRLLGVHPTEACIRRARALFALSLDIPGGLRVQTLHGFAQGLLASFPVEAGLPPGFAALDERDTIRLKDRALAEMVQQAELTGDPILDDLEDLAVQFGEGHVRAALDRVLEHAEGVVALGRTAAVDPALRRYLRIPADERRDQAVAQAVAAIQPTLVAKVAAGWEAWGTKTGDRYAGALRAWLALPAEDHATEEARALLWAGTLTQAGTPIKVNGAAKNSPDLAFDLNDLAERILAVRQVEQCFDLLDHASRTLRVGLAYAQRYEALKRAAVAIDYDDMIVRTARLLTQDGGQSWVNYKLDNRIDHILVDEAQDTNRAQWDIIRALATDFFAGEGTREGRTLFVVGDYKQAIYGFQGTDPEVFQQEHSDLGLTTEDTDRPLRSIPLDLSFRSGPAVLDVVNAFLATTGYEALGMHEQVPEHVPFRADAASQVTLWPVLIAGANGNGEGQGGHEEPGGDQPIDDEEDAGSAAADRLMAERLAAQVQAWLDPASPDRLWLPSRRDASGRLGRWVEPGDILILARKRSTLMARLVAELHRARVPVAGVDRLLLTEPYAVLDLLAAMRFAVQPEDDLNLACLLVSPFLNWTHEQVRAVAGPRGDATLWDALRTAAASDAEARVATDWLSDLIEMASRPAPAYTPYRFLDAVLSGPLRGRARLLGRLGVEQMQAIDELLTQALQYESSHAPTLEGFLNWITAEGVEVKRDPDAAGPEVRLMTVHGSKGLEAPVVVLADAAHRRRPDDDRYLPIELPGVPGEVPLFYPKKDVLSGDLASRYASQERTRDQEDLRLLYVALTRAADMLFIGGAIGRQAARDLDSDKDRRWHTRIKRVMAGLPDVAEQPALLWDGDAMTLRRGRWTEPDRMLRAEKARSDIGAGIDLSPAATPQRPFRPLTPTGPAEDESPRPPPTTAQRRAARRGTWMHKLFERLPGVARDRRAAVARQWLIAQGAEEADAEEIADTVLGVMHGQGYEDLFDPATLAEAPIAGLVGDVAIAGTVDRLLIAPDRVLVVDFKTGLFVPPFPERIPHAHLRQMAAYRAVLSAAFPGRPVQAGLLYTTGPRLHLLSDAQLDLHSPTVEPTRAFATSRPEGD